MSIHCPVAIGIGLDTSFFPAHDTEPQPDLHVYQKDLRKCDAAKVKERAIPFPSIETAYRLETRFRCLMPARP